MPKEGPRLEWHWDSLFTLFLIALVGWALYETRGFPLPSSRFLPQMVTIALLGLLALELLRRTWNVGDAGQIMDLGMRTGTGMEAVGRLAVGFISLPWASIGFALIFPWVNVPWSLPKRLWTLAPAALIALLVYSLFEQVTHTVWPERIFLNWIF